MKLFKNIVNNDGVKYKVVNGYIDEYTKKDGGLYNMSAGLYSKMTMAEIMEAEFEEIPWIPEMLDRYWFLNITYINGIDYRISQNTDIDKRTIKYLEVFRTEEEAKVERNKQDWWKAEHQIYKAVAPF